MSCCHSREKHREGLHLLVHRRILVWNNHSIITLNHSPQFLFIYYPQLLEKNFKGWTILGYSWPLVWLNQIIIAFHNSPNVSCINLGIKFFSRDYSFWFVAELRDDTTMPLLQSILYRNDHHWFNPSRWKKTMNYPFVVISTAWFDTTTSSLVFILHQNYHQCINISNYLSSPSSDTTTFSFLSILNQNDHQGTNLSHWKNKMDYIFFHIRIKVWQNHVLIALHISQQLLSMH